MANYALIGAAGYVAPRHMKAIKETNNKLLVALDKFDSVGVIDGYFPKAAFFTEFERFDRHLEKIKREGIVVDFLSVCTPNYLHDAHCRFGLRSGMDVICEKPLVINPWNLEAMERMEKETGQRVFNILQLRLHPSIIALKKRVESAPDKIYDIDLTYLTSRGNWYYTSWKGDANKSGGIATNIGIHFFDMLTWIFGEVKKSIVHIHTHDRAAGFLELKNANVRWFLSINADTIPEKIIGKTTYRSLKMDGEEVEFSNGFTDLHTRSYEEIMRGEGFGLNEVKAAINVVHEIRNSKQVGLVGEYHELASLDLVNHPFDRKK